MAVVERRADAVVGAEVGAQEGEAREGHDQPDEGDESDDADEPGVGRKVLGTQLMKSTRLIDTSSTHASPLSWHQRRLTTALTSSQRWPTARAPSHLHRLHLNPALFLGLPCCVPPWQTSPPVATKSMECLLWSQVSPPYPAKI